MSRTYDIAGLRALVGPVKWEDNPILVRQKSRDFYWYSPVLKRELEAVTADVVVTPTSEAEVRAVLAAAYQLEIPVTPRGAGTGNYGQAMPLMGGVLLNLAEMNKVKSIERGRVVCEPGALIIDVDKAAEASGQELRMYPSTRGTASIAGFVAGGSGGVGSINWGGLRDFGNVLRLRLMTMEASAASARAYRRGPAQGGARLWHQRNHHRGRDAADAALRLGRRHRRLRLFRRRGGLCARARRAGRDPEEADDGRRRAGAARLLPAPSRPHSARRERRHSDDRAALRSTPFALSPDPTETRGSCSTRAMLRPRRSPACPPITN